jgi:hypothetical protein
MALMPIDSVESLEEAELPPGAARAIVRVITNHVDTAVSGLATKDDLEKLRLATKRDFEACHQAIETSHQATERDIEAFRQVTTHNFEAFGQAVTRGFQACHQAIETSHQATKHEIEASRFVMKQDFGEFRVSTHRLLLKWSLSLFAALITSYASLCFLVIHYLQK